MENALQVVGILVPVVGLRREPVYSVPPVRQLLRNLPARARPLKSALVERRTATSRCVHMHTLPAYDKAGLTTLLNATLTCLASQLKSLCKLPSAQLSRVTCASYHLLSWLQRALTRSLTCKHVHINQVLLHVATVHSVATVSTRPAAPSAPDILSLPPSYHIRPAAAARGACAVRARHTHLQSPSRPFAYSKHKPAAHRSEGPPAAGLPTRRPQAAHASRAGSSRCRPTTLRRIRTRSSRCRPTIGPATAVPRPASVRPGRADSLDMPTHAPSPLPIPQRVWPRYSAGLGRGREGGRGGSLGPFRVETHFGGRHTSKTTTGPCLYGPRLVTSEARPLPRERLEAPDIAQLNIRTDLPEQILRSPAPCRNRRA